MTMYIALLLVLIVALALITAFYYVWTTRNRKQHDRLITCIMITGKDESREKLARHAIKNFREQTFSPKHLVIINHGPFTLVDQRQDHTMFNVTEIKIDKGDMTLGDLRNMAFDFVPYDGLFCVWDDDDYRAPNFLSNMYERLQGAQAVCFTKRLEYNAMTLYAWKTELRSGFVHVLATKNYMVRYLSKDSMEDVELLDRMRSTYKVNVFENDARMYVRLVHSNNTSNYVNPVKNDVVKNAEHANWQEHELNDEERRFIETVYVPQLP